MDRLKKYNLTLNPNKCEYIKTKIDFLGLEISFNQIKPSIDRIKAVTDIPYPTTIKEIESFMGFASYFRQFIDNFSKHAKSLHSLQKKSVKFEFTEQHKEDFSPLDEGTQVKRLIKVLQKKLLKTCIICK
jgi:hypothetical protein